MFDSRFKRKGFTLIELMVVVAIIGVLSMIAVPKFMSFLSKSKRAEAYLNLSALAMAEKAYWAEYGTYTTQLVGAQGLGWQPQGNYNYTYGFPGQEGANSFVGKLNAPSSELNGAFADTDTFLAYAVADIDGDGSYDILSVDENSAIKIIKDDLNN